MADLEYFVGFCRGISEPTPGETVRSTFVSCMLSIPMSLMPSHVTLTTTSWSETHLMKQGLMDWTMYGRESLATQPSLV